MTAEDTFTPDQVQSAIQSFLQVGEAYGALRCGHANEGYCGSGGWAAHVLRWHLKQLTAPPTDEPEILGNRHTILHAISLLRWWADDEGDDPDVLEHIQQSKECASELEANLPCQQP